MALLAMLGVARGKGWARDKLVGYLWPESSEGGARHRLSDSLYVLRHALGEEAVLATGDVLRLNPQVVSTDVGAFEEALEREDFEEAVGLYSGPLLDGFYLSGSGEWEHWLESERQRLAGQYGNALESLAQQAEDAGEYRRAVEWWQRRAAQDRYNSRVAVRLMQALAAAGDRAGALEHARVHELLVRDEIGMEPDAEVLALAEQLRREPAVAGEPFAKATVPSSGVAEGSATRALATEPADRFATASEFAEALEPVAVSQPAGRRVGLARVIGLYAATSVAVLATAYFLMLHLGLPDWFFSGAVFVLLVCLPVIVATALVQGAAVPAVAGAEATGRPAAARRWLTWRNAIGAGVVLFVLLGLAVTGYTAMRLLGIGPAGTLLAKGVLEERERIILADFENNTSDSLLAIAVTEAFRTDLSQSRLIWLVEPDYVNRVLAWMEREAAATLDYELAREVAVREGLKAVIAGEVSSAGAGYILSARLVAAESGETISAHREAAGDSTAIIAAIDRLSKQMRERIGESLKCIRSNEPLEQVTTSSLEALKRYSLASQAFRRMNYVRAIPLYEEAIALDTAFAAAYHALGATRFNRGELAEAVEALTKAYELRDRRTERGRYSTIGLYHDLVTGEADKAIDAYRTLVEISDSSSSSILVGLAVLYGLAGESALAEQLYRRLIEADSFRAIPYNNLSLVQIRQGKLEEAEVTVRRWAEKFPEHDGHRLQFAELPAVRGDYVTAEARFQEYAAYVDTVAGRSGRERLEARRRVAWASANVATARGKLAEASRHLRDAMAASRELGSKIRYLSYAIQLALLDVWYRGATVRGTQLLEFELDRCPLDSLRPLDRPYLALALFYALAEQPQRARALVAQYDTAWGPRAAGHEQKPIRQRIGGVLALAERRIEAAIQQLGPDESRYGCPECGLPMLAQAYERAGEPDSAIASYERYVNTPSDAPTCTFLDARSTQLADPFWLAFTYERLGNLYEQRGDRAKAVYYYGKLVELWKDADSELQPRVEAARRAIEALSQPTD